MDEAQNLADRVAVIAAGTIVAEGTPETLAGRDHGAALVRFRMPANLDPSELPLPAETALERVNGLVSFRTPAPTRTLAPLLTWAAARDIELEGLTVTRPSLEDVYLQLTDGGAR